jgi:enoyl-CoA hydratase
MDLSSYEHIAFHREGDVLVMTLNRPERLNAIHPPMRHEIVRAFKELDDDESRAVIITGAGRAFCAGGDVQRMDKQGGSSTREKFAQVRTGEIPRAQLDLEKPSIAMVNGVAVGLGASIALMCDVVVASETARIGDRHVNVGLVAGDGGALIWPLLVGINKAKELLMLGDLVEGADLERLGIVNHLVPTEKLEPFTMELAQRLAAMPPYAVKATKITVNTLLRDKLSSVLDLGLGYEHYSAKMADHREATSAWTEKRTATFTGK